MKRSSWLLVLILAVAIFFRFYHIKSTPPGLYPDEAMNGNNAVQAWETGNFKVFYPENNGREGLFINIQAISVHIFGNYPWALRLVSGIMGVLTVLGLYFLAKALFNTQVGLISSFLLAVSFWHVNFSRMGFRAIMAPLFLVWVLFFFWRGLYSTKFFHYILAGIFLGLGFHTYIAFRVAPLIFLLVLAAYMHFVTKDYGAKPYRQEEYRFLKSSGERGLIAIIIFAFLVSLPIFYYFLKSPDQFFGRTAQVSIFSGDSPLVDLATNFVKTLGMFNFTGDFNWRHNFSGSPMLVWPVGIFFAVGFIKSWIKFFTHRKRHGHFPTNHALLLSSFLVGIFPVVISDEGIPHALRAIIVVPIVFIFAGEGMWWFFEKLKEWYLLRDPHRHEASVLATLAIVLLLTAIGFMEFDKYFNKWGQNPSVKEAFNQNYVDIGKQINKLPLSTKKYVVVYAGGVLVNGISMPAQTVMYLTDSFTKEKQIKKNIFYITPDELGGLDISGNIHTEFFKIQ